MTTATRHFWDGYEAHQDLIGKLNQPKRKLLSVLPSTLTAPKCGCIRCICRGECQRLVRTPDPLLCEGDVFVRFDSGEIVRL